jgi:hypothetical protein
MRNYNSAMNVQAVQAVQAVEKVEMFEPSFLFEHLKVFFI